MLIQFRRGPHSARLLQPSKRFNQCPKRVERPERDAIALLGPCVAKGFADHMQPKSKRIAIRYSFAFDLPSREQPCTRSRGKRIEPRNCLLLRIVAHERKRVRATRHTDGTDTNHAKAVSGDRVQQSCRKVGASDHDKAKAGMTEFCMASGERCAKRIERIRYAISHRTGIARHSVAFRCAGRPRPGRVKGE